MSNFTNERNNNLENGISIRISPELFATMEAGHADFFNIRKDQTDD